MSEEFSSIIDTSYDNGTPLWLSGTDYIYGMVPVADNDRWVEVSYTFEDPDEPLYKTERAADLSFQFLMEELTKGIGFYCEDFKSLVLREFVKNNLEGKSGAEKISGVINELISNGANYAANLPIIKSKDELGTLKSKL